MPQPPILWSNISRNYSGLRSAGRIKNLLPRTANSIIDPYALGFASFLASFFLLWSCPKEAICTQVLCSGSTFRETHSKESIHFLLSKETETKSKIAQPINDGATMANLKLCLYAAPFQIISKLFVCLFFQF